MPEREGEKLSAAAADSGATLLGYPIAGANYYWFFTGLMLVVATAFIFFALRYKGDTFIQDVEDQEGLEPEAEGEAEGASR